MVPNYDYSQLMSHFDDCADSLNADFVKRANSWLDHETVPTAIVGSILPSFDDLSPSADTGLADMLAKLVRLDKEN